MMIALLTGPVRSGKSTYAARVAAELNLPIVYIATARLDSRDAEMVDRVERHRADRAPDVESIELWLPGAPDLPAIVASARPDTTLLVDSLGSWIAGHMLDLEELAERNAVEASVVLESRTSELLPRLLASRANIVLVAEETGWGIVPASSLARIFRDQLGRLAQAIGRRADRLELVVAGYALDLKRHGVCVRAET